MKRDHYHYGDLRGDPGDTTISLLEERGVQAFSMAKQAVDWVSPPPRRIGTSPTGTHFSRRGGGSSFSPL